MESIKSMGDLRMFLVETMQGVRSGTVSPGQAGQIAKLAAQINASVHAEIAVRTHLKVEDRRPFNDLALIEADDTRSKANQVSTKPDEEDKVPEEIHPRQASEEREEAAEWYPDDWQEIRLLLDAGKSKREVAERYGVSLKQLEQFITENTTGEALPRPRTGV